VQARELVKRPGPGPGGGRGRPQNADGCGFGENGLPAVPPLRYDKTGPDMKKSRRHALGQHFLASRGVLAKIAAVISPGPDDLVVEIGAGKGALTAVLAAAAGRVVAIEKDARLLPALRLAVPANVEVVHADALTFDFRGLLDPRRPGRLRAAGNLPYSISSPLLFRILDERELFSDAVFLVQKEVAGRVTAGPRTKSYAPLSILIQNYFAARVEFTVPPGAFSPPPKVTSALLSLRRRPAPLLDVSDEPLFRNFLRAAFARRRKLLRGNLASCAGGEALAEAWERTGLPKCARAEELAADRLAALFEALLPHLVFESSPMRRESSPREAE
jgi:16S rRNA (adenine1518-N6/adenine1519-N6)-dimethyltransferase